MSKAETNRANAAKSTGPISPTGKSKVAQNARKHGLTARQIVLPGESEADYEHLLRAYTDHFKPETPPEFELVSVMAGARWRHRRLTVIETGLYKKEMAEDRDEELGVRHLSEEERIVWAYDMLTLRSHGFNALVRHDVALSRTHDRALKQLQSMRESAKQSQIVSETAPATDGRSTT